MAHGTFATTINCIDGRTQSPLSQWIKDNFHVDFVDTVTAPGVNKTISQTNDQSLINQIKQATAISVNAHGSQLIVLAGHYDCAGNPVSNDQHALDIRQSCAMIKEWGMPVRVVGVWVNDSWQIDQICDSEN